jgi:hypothetical protein
LTNGARSTNVPARGGRQAPCGAWTRWTYHDADRFPDLAEKRREGVSVTDVYRAHGIEDYQRLRTTIFTRPANEREVDS